MGNSKKTVFDSEDVSRMSKACDAATSARPDLDADSVAKRIIDAASDGENKTERLKKAGVGKT